MRKLGVGGNFFAVLGFLLRERIEHIARSILAGSDGNAVGKRTIQEYTTPSPLLDLHLCETVLPNSDEWGDAVLAVVHEDDPEQEDQ